MNLFQSSLEPKSPRVCLGIVIGAAVFAMNAKVHAVCGLGGAVPELVSAAKNPDALRELNRQLLPIGRFSESCKVCHVAGPGGPRNGFGSAVNALLTLSDREDPVRQREVGQRMTDIPSNPTVLDSPTFGELFQRGELPETIFTPQDGEVGPNERVPETETLTVEGARERVRQAMAESRFGILQLSKVQEITPEVAEELAKFEGEALILGIRSLTPWVAEELARSRAANVWLHSVTSVFPGSGEVIAKVPGGLVMTGLSRLDSVTLAEKLIRRPGALSFPYLEEVSPEIATVLAKEERSLTLAGLARPSPEVQEKLAGTAGALYLPYLKTLDSMPLTEKLASGLLVLPRIGKLSGEQAKVFASIKGADSFFGGYFFPMEAMTPEVADVIAESWERVRLTLVGKNIPSDEVLRTLKKSRIGIVLRDVEEVTTEQARIIAESEGASINLPGLKRLDSALLAEKFQGLFPSVTSISPEAAAVLGKLPDSVRTLRDGTVDVRPSGDLFLPSLKELPTETARLLLKKRWLSISLPVLEDVSLATIQSLARQTFRLTIGIRALPPEFADAFAETPTDSTMGGGYILLPNVSDLSPEAARILVKSLNRGVEDLGHTRISKSPKLYFGGDFHSFGGGFPSLSPEVAVELAKYEGFLAIRGLGELPDASAAALASFPGPYLVLTGPATQSLSPEAAQSLAKVPGVLQIELRDLDSVPLAERFARQINWTLYRTETVSKEAAPALSQYKQFFDVRFLTVLDSPEMARRFVEGTTSGTGITLPALSTLTAEAAEILGAGPKSLYLGLTVLDSPAVAAALAESKAGVNLFRLRAATAEVIAILKEAKSIETPPLESVYVLSKTNG